MDFSNRNYYLIGINGQNSNIPKQLKKYFKCKIRCHAYYYDDVFYTHCVSINKEHCFHLIAFLNDFHIDYKPIVKQFEKASRYQFKYYSDEYIKAKRETQQRVQEMIGKFEIAGQKAKEREKYMKLEYLEMLNDMTNATNLDITEIVIYGYDGFAHRQQLTTSNRCLIEKFLDMCVNHLKEESV